MKQDNEDLVLNIQESFTGDVTVLSDFFKVSHFTQASMLEDFVLPLLFDGKNVYLTIGVKK